VNRKYEEKDGKFICPYCGNLYSKYGIENHINITHKKIRNGPNKGKEPWNKGLTKKTDERMNKLSINTSKGIQKWYLSQNKSCLLHYNICEICGKISLDKSSNKKCSKCRQIEGCRKGGIKSAKTQKRRSKKEIKLFQLLSQKYECLSNENIFNGWDADIIIPSLKIAILWNGPWHYQSMFGNHSLKQVQNRDDIKMNEIIKNKYNFIVICDWNNSMSPDLAFKEIENAIKNNHYNMTIF
jgi:hypothetical protein